jgi:hypothetical protein
VTFVVWIAISLAAVVFVIFAGRPLYNTYKTRGQGAALTGRDAREPRPHAIGSCARIRQTPASGRGPG